MRPLPVTVEATDGEARTGRVDTPRGGFTIPCFCPVGTRAAVKHLDAVDLEGLGVEVALANTYHLMLRPGARVVERLGGLHRFTGFAGHWLTDSGGYQVFSLPSRVDDDGVTFRSTYDGATVRLTPEEAVRTQEALGADIQMALDVCPGLPAPPEVLTGAVERTLRWAERARAAHRRADQALFGIVQGGDDPDLRAGAARRTVALDFDGYGIGGFSVGEDPGRAAPALAATVAELPADRVRYLMGVGDPLGILEAVSVGVDMFDCVLPTRLGRHGTILTERGPVNLRRAEHRCSDEPLDPDVELPTNRWTRGYVRHLLVTGEPTGRRIATLHNLAWLGHLVDRARRAIRERSLSTLLEQVRETHPRRPARRRGA